MKLNKTENLINTLINTVQLLTQVDAIQATSLKTEKTWPDQMQKAEEHAIELSKILESVREEIEVDIGHKIEAGDSIPVLINRLNNTLMTLKESDQLIKSLRDVDSGSFRLFVTYILQYGGSVLEEVVKELDDLDRENLCRIFCEKK